MARLSLFILSDGSDCQIWVSRKRNKNMMVVERKTHALVYACFALNYTADPGKMCVWIKNRLKDWWYDWFQMFSRALKRIRGIPTLPFLIWVKNGRVTCLLTERQEKAPEVPLLSSRVFSHPKALVILLEYQNVLRLCGSIFFPLWKLISCVLFQTSFALVLPAAICLSP